MVKSFCFLFQLSLFKNYEYIQNELKLVPLISKVLKQLGYSNKEDLNNVSKFLLYSIDSIIHRHVISEDKLLKDEDLVNYLAVMIMEFIKSNVN